MRPVAAWIDFHMMSADECAAKAAELTERADKCFSEEAEEQYRIMAAEWRGLQMQATWQDDWTANHPRIGDN